MTTSPAIRAAVVADLPALQRVFRAASLSNAGEAPMLLARPEFLVFAGDGIADGRTLVAVAGAPQDRIVGFATVTTGPELEDLFVDPDWHRRGVARQLVGRVAETARAQGHRRLWVTGNPHALAFYLAVGFVQVDQVATELGVPGLRMSLDLTGGHP
ncbi:GNAT family N-acetyltransferase [Actinoplanes sp. TBRC 11911]|uniref:GNAT family N-acetyltransferase n=1 Tax=Actinoplanes sp. TBRC 11911 TaxID=2729386 RepID=UPI00145D60FA|nr:GNAT family N-acetyltransferase [Actinoplanes sp. TBRC 11911]NMO51945.1 GNAT family N-acetyltransferase [Actinoplanes sp. TBRC 11911]